MRHDHRWFYALLRRGLSLSTASLLLVVTGCSSVSTSPPTPVPPTVSGPQTYFGPPAAGASYSSVGSNGLIPVSFTLPQTYSLDDQADVFSQTTYGLAGPAGPQLLNAGKFSILERGLRGLNISATYAFNGNTTPVEFDAYPFASPGESGSFAVELAGQTGGLIQMLGQPAVPLVAATQCPSFSTAQSYQFITIPAGLNAGLSTGPIEPLSFNPAIETAFGSVDITSSGSTVTFQNIQQHTLPSGAGLPSGTPGQPTATPVTGACGPTVLGETTVVPGLLAVSDPGSINPVSNSPPQASVGISSSGLLVEYNGAATSAGILPNTSPALNYNNLLGAGTGAVGLPKPASALSTSDLVGAQYLGFIYGAGAYIDSSDPSSGWSSEAASFGFASVPSSCSSLTPGTPTLIYGGDFPANNPGDPAIQANGGYGNCDYAVDLGTQDSTNNGLYPNATIWIGAGYGGNLSGVTYSFPAVAIAGQLGGKYALFVIGADSIQPWAIYLLQSN